MNKNQNEKGCDDPGAQRDQYVKWLCVLDKYGRSQRSDDQCRTSHYYYVKSRAAIIYIGNT